LPFGIGLEIARGHLAAERGIRHLRMKLNRLTPLIRMKIQTSPVLTKMVAENKLGEEPAKVLFLRASANLSLYKLTANKETKSAKTWF